MVREEAGNDLLQRSPLLRDRLMHSPSQFVLNLPKLRAHAVPPGLPLEEETPLAGRITFGLRNLARSDGKSATNIPSRFVASTIASCIATAMKLHGGPGSMSTLFRSLSNCGGARAPPARTPITLLSSKTPSATSPDNVEQRRIDVEMQA